MPWTVIPQTVKHSHGRESEVLAKPIRFAPNSAGKMNKDGEVPEFIGIPTVVVMFIRNDAWLGDVSLNPECLESVFKLTYSPRYGTFTLHHPHRLEVNPKNGERKIEPVKSKGLTLNAMRRYLAENNVPADFTASALAVTMAAGEKKTKAA